MSQASPTVLWLIDSLHMGGAEQLAVEFAGRVGSDRIQLEIVALREGGGMLPTACPQHVVGARSLRDPCGFLRLCRLLRQRRAEVLHTHLRYAHIWGSLAAQRVGIPCLSTLHVLPQPVADWRERMLAGWETRRLLRGSQRVIAVSHAQAEAWRSAGLAAPHLTVIPNGVEPLPRLHARERQELRMRLGLPVDACIFLTVAVVRGLKGWRHLLRAIPAIRAAHPQAYFVWVGDGPEFAELRESVAAARLNDAVLLPGRRQDVPQWLQAADVFLFPSEEEALPTALLEAMAAGLPAVASRLPAVEEVLRGSGRMIAPGDAEALAAGAIELAASVPMREQEGQELRRIIEERYSSRLWVDTLVATYRQVLDEAERKRRRRSTARARATGAPPRLLAVEPFSRGGLFHYTAQLTQALARQGAVVSLLTGGGAETGDAGLAGVRLLDHLWTWNPHRRSRWLPRRLQRWIRGGLYLAAWLQIVAAIHREQPDVVLFGDFEHRCDAWFIAWLARRGPVLADIWHNVTSFDRYGGEGLVRIQPWRAGMARHFQTIFVHGEALARQFQQTTGYRATVIPHGNQRWIEEQAGADPGLDHRLDLPAGRPVALLFGSLTRYKGIDLLIDAMRLLPEVRRPIVVVAGHPLADCRISDLQAQADCHGIAPWLRWQTGYIPTPHVAWYFRRADFIVLPYRTASQSGVAHLALTFGKPLIVTRTGSLPELIPEQANGIVIAPGDAAALAAALDLLSHDTSLRLRMGLVSRRLAETRHDWDQIARQVLSALPLVPARRKPVALTRTGAIP